MLYGRKYEMFLDIKQHNRMIFSQIMVHSAMTEILRVVVVSINIYASRKVWGSHDGEYFLRCDAVWFGG